MLRITPECGLCMWRGVRWLHCYCVGHNVKHFVKNTFYHLVFKQGILTYLLLSKLNRVLFFNWEGLLKAGVHVKLKVIIGGLKRDKEIKRFFLTQPDN